MNEDNEMNQDSQDKEASAERNSENVELEQKSEDKSSKDGGKKDESTDGFFKSTMNYIRKSLKSKENDDPEEGDDSENKSADLSKTNIPDDFSNIAESLGWSGDDIMEFASKGNDGKPYTDAELLSMVPDMMTLLDEDEESKSDDADKEKVVSSEVKSEASDSNKELREQLKKEILEELNLENLQDELKTLKEERQTSKDIAVLNRANELFDNMSKESEIFGLTNDLPKYPAGKNKGKLIVSSPAVKARAEVFGDALAFMNHHGTTIDEAMAKAHDTYRGKHLKDKVRRDVIKDLKSHEKNLSGPRTAKEVKKTYPSQRDEEIDFIRNLQRAAGQDT